MPWPKAVLFDLDGTLTDSFLGITNGFRFVLEHFGKPVPTAAELDWCIGPPLQTSLARLLGEDLVDEAVRVYRERYGAIGCYECTVYDGVPEMLRALQRYDLYICTSKTEVYVPRILEHAGLVDFFSGEFGASYDLTRSDKADVIAHCLAETRLKPEECVMIGDRMHDMVGATQCGVEPIGAGWGYALPGELESAGARFVADHPLEIVDLLEDLREIVVSGASGHGRQGSE